MSCFVISIRFSFDTAIIAVRGLFDPVKISSHFFFGRNLYQWKVFFWREEREKLKFIKSQHAFFKLSILKFSKLCPTAGNISCY